MTVGVWVVSVAAITPSAVWWMWGSIITALDQPLFGDLATVSGTVIVQPNDLPDDTPSLNLLASSVHSALPLHRVDAALVIITNHRESHAPDLAVWRRRASRAIVDLHSKEAIHAGFIEVTP